MQEKEQTTDEAGNQQISNSKVEDNGAKLIFENPTLCAQLLRDYSNIDLLKNVQAEDITDVTERYIPMFTEERNADVVKQVRVGDNDEVFVTLIEHKSQVDYNVSMQILRYMVYIWEDYEKRQEKKIPGVSKLAGFKYPPIFPIVYYNGEETWTADNFLKSRIALSDIFLPYVPDYKYHLVNTADHDKDELIEKNDGLSFLMILNKVRNSEDEIQDFVSQIKERRMSDLFANFKATVNVEERKIGQNKGEVIKLIKIVRAKYLKGQDVEQIAEDLVESVETVSEIYEVVKSHEADYDVDKLYDELEKVKKR